MKALLILFVGIFLSFGAQAQAPDFDDLKILNADYDYERLVRQCEKYMDKDDTKKNPFVYLWMTKALYGIDISGSDNENFKNAFKDGLGYLGKCFKYDEDGEVQAEHDEFIDEFSMACVERILNDISVGDYRKAFGWNIKYKKIARSPAGMNFMDGACKYRNSDKSGANAAWKLANNELEDVTSIEDWAVADIALLKHGVIQTAEAMISGKQLEKAKELMNKVAPWFEDDDDFQAQYDKIVN